MSTVLALPMGRPLLRMANHHLGPQAEDTYGLDRNWIADKPFTTRLLSPTMSKQEDPLIAELRTFLGSYAEHDLDCPAFDAVGPAVLDPANCTCGLTEREQELVAKIQLRLGLPNDVA